MPRRGTWLIVGLLLVAALGGGALLATKGGPTFDMGCTVITELTARCFGIVNGWTDPDPPKFAWDFGDGATLPATVDADGDNYVEVDHAYATAGTYSVLLSIFYYPYGAEDFIPLSKTVVVERVADFVASVSTVSVDNSTRTITLRMSASGGTPPYTTVIKWGDGVESTSFVQGSTSHTYAASDTYKIDWKTSDSVGRFREGTFYTRIADLTAKYTYTGTDLTVTFEATASGGNPPYTFSWDFGDDTTGAGSKVKHVYAEPGEYTVTLVVRDVAGASIEGSVTLSLERGKGVSGSGSIAISGILVSVIGIVPLVFGIVLMLIGVRLKGKFLILIPVGAMALIVSILYLLGVF